MQYIICPSHINILFSIPNRMFIHSKFYTTIIKYSYNDPNFLPTLARLQSTTNTLISYKSAYPSIRLTITQNLVQVTMN